MVSSTTTLTDLHADDIILQRLTSPSCHNDENDEHIESEEEHVIESKSEDFRLTKKKSDTCTLLITQDVEDFTPPSNSNRRRNTSKASLELSSQLSKAPETPSHPVSLRRKEYRVFVIAHGSCDRMDFTASQLLRIVHMTRPPGIEHYTSGLLKLRDLRQICTGQARPSIEPRRSCVLVNMPEVRAIILRNRVFLIGTEGRPFMVHTSPTNAMSDVLDEPLLKKRNFSSTPNDESDENQFPGVKSNLVRKLIRLSALKPNQKQSAPFEFMALEAILFEVISQMEDAANPAFESIETFTRERLQQLSSTQYLHKIREIKRFLQEAESLAAGVNSCLSDLLADEEDVRRLEVSRFWETPHEWDEPSDSPGAEEAEILLESYQQDIDGVLQKIRDTDESIDTILQIMQLQLAQTRNLLLKFEILLQVFAVIVGIVAAVAGIFGMNVPNGYENSKGMFWYIVRWTTISSILIYFTVFVVAMRLKL